MNPMDLPAWTRASIVMLDRVTPFIIVGAAGLILLLVSLVADGLFDLLDGALSATGLGSALTVFGAVGVICTANDLPSWSTYLISALVAIAVLVGVQLLIRNLRRGEDGTPSNPVGLYGTARSTITGSSGEVSLDGPNEIETRMAFSLERIEVGERIHVVDLQGTRVRVERAADATSPSDS